MDVRLGPELLGRVEAFQREIGAENLSAAVRTLIQLGLEKVEPVDVKWRKLAWREGVVSASAVFKQAIAEAADKALKAGGVE